MKPRLTLLVVLVIVSALLFAPANPLAGQAPDAPIVFLLDNDLWAWHGPGSTLTRLTEGLHITEVMPSPDGTRLGLLALSPVTVDALERVGFFSGTWPADIGILDLASGAVEMVAVQPEDTVLFAEGSPPAEDNVLMRSVPTWSPDGTALAWTEVHYPSFASETNRLLAYDLAAGTTRTLVTGLPETAGVPGPIEVSWGGPGLALHVPSYDAASMAFFTELWVYSGEGELLSQLRVPEDEKHILMDYTWAQTASGDLLGISYFHQDSVILLDPLTGEKTVLNAPLEMVSTSAPGESAAFTFTRDPDAADIMRNYLWQAALPDGQIFALDYHGGTILIAPDGSAFGYVTYEALHEDGRLVLWQDGVMNPDALAIDGWTPAFWGPTGWRVPAASAGE